MHVRDATDTSRSSPEESLSNGITSITTSGSDVNKDAAYLGHDLNASSLEQKIVWLAGIFPDIPQRELADVLESHEGLLDKTTDELLNLSFLYQENEEQPEEHVPILKGVDGFAEGVRNNRKGRKKWRNRTNDSSRASSQGPSTHETESIRSNIWSSMSEDVDFICSRTILQPQAVRSTYHANGARLSSTIRALATKEGSAYTRLTEIDPLVELQITEFQTQFEQVPEAQIYGLLILARKIPSAAFELVEAMTATEASQQGVQLHGVAHYAPLDLKGDIPLEPPSTTVSASAVLGHSRASATTYRAAATESFEQATAAYKKSKSDRLYRAVAGYHADIGRERAKAAKELQAGEADYLVASQSSSTVLDLHGVGVQDAVRIASVRTKVWWESLGDTKYAPGGGGPATAGFRIVTGVGSHSKNHAPRIGPAVSKMLIREGWKVEIGHGELYVTGKNRR